MSQNRPVAVTRAGRSESAGYELAGIPLSWQARSMFGPDVPTENLTMWRADVIVLFDWLMTTDLNTVPITHPAQKQALADLLTCIEGDADVSGVSQDQIDEASRAVAADMGW